MSKQEIEAKYFTNKGKYSAYKSEAARQEHKSCPNSKQTSKNAIRAFDNLFKK